MALKALEHDAETRFGLEDVFEDVFDDRDTSAAKLAWVNGWRKLPHIDRAVQRLFDYPQQFAEDIYNRIESELRRRDTKDTTVQKPGTCISCPGTIQRMIRRRRRFWNCRPATSSLRTRRLWRRTRPSRMTRRNFSPGGGKRISLSVTKRQADGLPSRRTCSPRSLARAAMPGLPGCRSMRLGCCGSCALIWDYLRETESRRSARISARFAGFGPVLDGPLPAGVAPPLPAGGLTPTRSIGLWPLLSTIPAFAPLSSR